MLVHARGDGDQSLPHCDAHRRLGAALRQPRRVPEAEINAEKEILAKQPDVQDKPDEVREKIVEGRIRKWLEDIVLEDQSWIHDPNRKVGEVLAESKLEVLEFRRLSVAE